MEGKELPMDIWLCRKGNLRILLGSDHQHNFNKIGTQETKLIPQKRGKDPTNSS